MNKKFCLYFLALLSFLNVIKNKEVTENINCNILGKDKEDCGYVGIDQKKCEEKGCCFKITTDNTPWCYKSINSDNNDEDNDLIYYEEESNSTENGTNKEVHYFYLELDPLLPKEIKEQIKKNPTYFKDILKYVSTKKKEIKK